ATWRIAPGDESARLGGARRRGAKSLVRQAISGTAPQRGRAPRFRGRRVGADRPRGDRGGLGAQRKPRLPPPRGGPARRARTSRQQRAPARRRPKLGAGGGAGGGGVTMLSDCELDVARDTIRRALQEDLRYGPDITTLATVSAGSVATASMVPREPGV